MDPKRILEQFLGGQFGGQAPSQGGDANQPAGVVTGGLGDLARQAKERLGASGFPTSLPSGLPGGIGGGALGGLAAGGLLGLLMGSKKVRKMAGGAAGVAGGAALGALALKAWQTWQAAPPSNPAPVSQPAPVPAPLALGAPDFEAVDTQLGADGKPFALALVRAMIAAANADGHIGPEEHKLIFEKSGRLELAADDKAFIFDAMAQPGSAVDIAALAANPEQGAELYAASRFAIDPDDPRERAYLDLLASALRLPPGFRVELDRQIERVPA